MRTFKNGTSIAIYMSEDLLDRLDSFIRDLNCSRSAFIEEAVERYLASFPTEEDAE